MPVDPQFSTILPRLPQAIAMSRALAEGRLKPEDLPPMPPMPPPTPVAHVEDREVPTSDGTVPVRIYAPRRDAILPLVMYFHGGGFISGNLDTHDELVRQLALAADCVIVSVSYRLAPAHPYPSALHDCLAALNWAVAHAGEIGANALKLGVAGDSAGGNLAAVTAMHIRDKGGPALSAQVLIYPGTDMAPPRTGSMLASGEGYYISQADMDFYNASYLGGKDPKDPYISPLRAKSLAGLAPALVLTAEYDPLRDQGQAYAKRLAEAGVPIEFVNFEGAIHGFLSFPVPMGHQAIASCGAWLREQLA